MPPSKNTDTRSARRPGAEAPARAEGAGERAAALLKYYRQFTPGGVQYRPVELARISAKGLYQANKGAFDRLAKAFGERGLDLGRYIKFFAVNLDRRGIDLNEELVSRRSLSMYAEAVQAVDKKRKIYGWFMKSARNVAKLSAEGGYASAKDFVLAAIRDRRLAQLYVGGVVSKYFLAAIPGFRGVIPKLDHFAKLEFADLLDRFDLYNSEVNEALLAVRKRVANPFKIADEELEKEKAVAAPRRDAGLFDDSL